ncbi:hypothetical protein D3C81_786920 [compost metagenome]
MMLSRKDHLLHPRSFHRSAPLISIEMLEVKYFWIFCSATPFHFGKGIGTKVYKCNEFIF